MIAPHPDPLRSRDDLTIEAASHLAWVEGIEQLAVHVASEHGLDADSACFLGVAVREALVNAIQHGHGFEPGRRVRVGMRIDRARSRLIVTVRDRGPGFEPASVPDPLAPENLTRSSGRGILLMRRLTDRVGFSFPPGGGTRVRLEKRLPRRAA